MNKQILVPDIGDFENVEIVEVLVKKGDIVKINDPLITLESDKSSVEVPSTEQGTIEKINVKIGDKVSKGDLILSIIDQSSEEKITIPPVTEKIIDEAEKSLKQQNNTNNKNDHCSVMCALLFWGSVSFVLWVSGLTLNDIGSQ